MARLADLSCHTPNESQPDKNSMSLKAELEYCNNGNYEKDDSG
jgi:hypothetical protein